MSVQTRLLIIRVVISMLTIGLAFLLGGFIIIGINRDPLAAYYWLFQGAFSPHLLPETLVRATPLLFISVGLAIAFTARVWNIGAEGQLYIGGMFAAMLAVMFKDAPAFIAFPAIILVAGMGGSLWALIPSILKAFYGVNEIITTLMMNYVAIYFVSYLLSRPFRDPVSLFPETETISSHLLAPVIVSGTRIHLGVLIAFLIIVPLAYFFLKKTVHGLRLEILGSNPGAAQYAGIDSRKMIIQVMLISGFLSGLAGGFEVLGIQHKMRLELSPSHAPYGYTAIAVALLGYLNPVLIAVASVFIGGIINGTMTMHRMVLIPVGMANIFQAFIIIFMLVGFYVEEKLTRKALERWKL